MLRTDIIMAKGPGLCYSQFHDPLGPGRIIKVPGTIFFRIVEHSLHPAVHGLKINAHGMQRPGRNTFPLMEQSQKQMLGADIVLFQVLCLILGIFQHLYGPAGKSVVHNYHSCPARGPSSICRTISARLRSISFFDIFSLPACCCR